MTTKSNRRKLVELKQKHGLTYAEIAELGGAGVKMAERWLASPGASSYVEIPDHRLELIELRLRLRNTKKPKEGPETMTTAVLRAPVRAAHAERAARLTDRQREVAVLLARGLSSKQVALELGMSPRTAEAHRAEAFRVLEVHNVAQLAVLIDRAGLLGELAA